MFRFGWIIILCYGIYGVLIPNIGAALNLTDVGVHDPTTFVHFLDAEPWGTNYMLACGAGGLWVYDISQGDVPIMASHLGVQGQQFYNTWATGNIGIATRRHNGAAILNLNNPSNPTVNYNYEPQNRSIEDGLLQDGWWWMTAHNEGLVAMEHGNYSNTVQFLESELNDAWGLVYHPDGMLFVANGAGGVAGVQITNAPSANLIWQETTTGSAIDVKWEGNRLVVAVGDAGFDVFDISNVSQPQFLNNVNTPNFCNHVSISQGKVAVADWEQLLVYDVETGELVGSKYTPGRMMGVYMTGDEVFASDWSAFRHYRYGYIPDADIEVEPRQIILSFVPQNQSFDTTLVVSNVGHSILNVNSVQSSSSAFSVQPQSFSVSPEDSALVTLTYIHNSSLPGNATLRFWSNDPDEPRTDCRAIGHGGAVSIGDPAPNFTTPLLYGGNFTLSDHLGDVVLMVFWATW